VNRHLLPAVGPIALGKLKARDVDKLLNDLSAAEFSSSERFKAGSVLRRALRAAVIAELIATNPASKVKLPKIVRPEKTWLDERQAVKLLKTTQRHRLAAFFDVALDTGARPAELYGLHWPDVDWVVGSLFTRRSLDGQTLKETKTTKGRRVVSLARRTVAALTAHRERMRSEGRDVEGGPVFCNTDGGFLHQQNVLNRVLRPLLKSAGLPPIRIYDLRHTSATLLLSKDVYVKVVRER
jgi:integrase